MSTHSKPYYQLYHDWAQETLSHGQEFHPQDAYDWFDKHYPGSKSNTLTMQLGIMTVNNPSRIHHTVVRPQNGRDLFYKISKDRYRLWDPATDPTPIYRAGSATRHSQRPKTSASPQTGKSTFSNDSTNTDRQFQEFAYEKDLQNYLVRNLNQLEPGLRLYQSPDGDGVEFNAGGRRIDILATSEGGDFVVIELKVSRGYDKVLGQIQRYIAWIKRELAGDAQVRGIIVASDISDDLKLAASQARNISLCEYELHFTLKPIPD